MNLDSSGGAGVTADSQKVRPGMIYVDLSRRRSKRRIYEAYENGASLIFTSYNISDPNLPVIKVDSPRDTLYKLIDRYYENQNNQARLIGVFGESSKGILIELIQDIFRGKSKENKRTDILPITIDAIDSNVSRLFYFDMNFDCAIITDRSSLESNYGNQSTPEFVSRLPERKTIIINNDEYHGIRSTEDLMGIRFITYGLNKKAAVTASSIDVDETTCFNYCVQSSFITRSGARIEPFEIPIRLNVLGTHNIYNALAAITCGLYYDEDILNIKESIEAYKAQERHFQKIYEGDFTIIDNYCSSLREYITAFDSIQILSYENLVLIVSVSTDENMVLHERKARLISEWVRILKCRDVILTSCMDGDSHIKELPLKSMRIYKKVFKGNDITFKYYHLLHHAIEKSLSLLNKHDLLVMLGSDEMSIARKVLYRQIRTANGRMN